MALSAFGPCHAPQHFGPAAVLLAVAVFASGAKAQIGLGLSPMRLELGMAPGAVQSGTLTLSNESSEVIRVKAQVLDFLIDPQGTPQFSTDFLSERESSCRTWLSVNPMETEIGPGQAIPARYTLRIPVAVPTGSFHCAVGFSTVPTLSEVSGFGLRSAIRMVTAIYAVVGHPATEGEVRSMRLEPVSGTRGAEWCAIVTMHNWGPGHFRPAGTLTISNEQGVIIEDFTFPPLPVLPKRDQQFVFRLKSRLNRQRYLLRTSVDIGAAEVQETTVHIVPPLPET